MATKSVLPFSIFKRKDSKFYYVRFFNEITGGYLPAKTTKETSRKKAVETALKWYAVGVDKQGCKKDVKELAIKENIKKSDFTIEELNFFLMEYKKRGLLKGFTIAGSKQDIPAYAFMSDFWTWEKSEYIREKLRQNHSIGKRHVSKMFGAVKNYWREILSNKVLNDVSKQDIKNIVEKLAGLSLSAKSKNDIIRAGTTPLRWAYNNELIENDVTQGIIFFSGISAPRQILTKELAQTLFSIEWNDQRAKLANMLAMCTGLRAGEIQALKLKSLGKDCLYINHSWNFQDGLKSTKNGECRTVYVPFPQVISALKNLGELNPFNQDLEGYIFWSTSPGKPMEQKNWLMELRKALKQIGLSEESSKKYCFHSWRHFFTAYMKNRVDDRILQRQTGHKTLEMLEHYASHELSGEQFLLETEQIKTFGDVLCNSPAISFNQKQLYKTVQIGEMSKAGLYEHSRQNRK